MRAKEFTINVPITITINGDEDPVVSAAGQDSDDSNLQQNPVMVAPQQQELELKKAELGKSSPVIDKLLQNSNIGQEQEPSEKDQLLSLLKSIMNR